MVDEGLPTNNLIMIGRLLYLDEPTTGLDPRSRTDVWGMVRELVANGVTVLLTTQYLDEADQLAHDIVVFDHGRVVATGTPDELKAKTGGQVLQVAADPARMAEVAALMTELIRGEVSADAETGVATAPVGDWPWCGTCSASSMTGASSSRSSARRPSGQGLLHPYRPPRQRRGQRHPRTGRQHTAARLARRAARPAGPSRPGPRRRRPARGGRARRVPRRPSRRPLPAARPGGTRRDNQPGVQREQSEQDPQLATADVDLAPRLVPHLKRA